MATYYGHFVDGPNKGKLAVWSDQRLEVEQVDIKHAEQQAQLDFLADMSTAPPKGSVVSIVKYRHFAMYVSADGIIHGFWVNENYDGREVGAWIVQTIACLVSGNLDAIRANFDV